MGEMKSNKKVMPFVQNLKKRLTSGENADVIFDRKLAFNELDLLEKMVPGLKKAAGLTVVEIVKVDEDGKNGVVGDDKKVEGLPPQAESAVPGAPTFGFENVEV